MPLDFTGKASKPAPTRRGPPNYSSRRLQIRLLLLVFTLMAVLVAMDKARDPRNFAWLGFSDSDIKGGTPALEDVDTRLLRAQKSDDESTLGTVTVSPNRLIASAQTIANGTDTDLLANEKNSRWVELLTQLERDERRHVYRVLKGAREKAALPEDQRVEWLRILSKLDEGWKQSLEESHEAVAKMEGEEGERAKWLLLLSKLEENWNLQKDALIIAAEGRPLIQADRQALDELQASCDRVMLAAVEDNTLANRYQEHDAWFRTLDKLRTSSLESLGEKSLGLVSFLQLYKQPKHYRGQLVTVRGSVRMAYHVRAPRNDYKIDGYYVFWIKPDAGPNTPLMVYSLDTPAGFPEVKDKDVDRTTTELHEEVEFTGYFFKNCVYRAKDATRVTPMLMAKVPSWDGAASGNRSQWQMPSPPVAILGVVGVAVIGIMISVVVYYRHRNTSPLVEAYSSATMNNPKRLEFLKKEELRPEVGHSLRQLGDEEDDNHNDEEVDREMH